MTGEEKMIIEEMHKIWVAVTENNIIRDKAYPYGLGKAWDIKNKEQ